MKQIYNFEQQSPPVLNENILRNKQEKKKFNIQTALLIVACFLIQFAVALFGYSAIDWYPQITLLCYGYVFISTTGGILITFTYTKKEVSHYEYRC